VLQRFALDRQSCIELYTECGYVQTCMGFVVGLDSSVNLGKGKRKIFDTDHL